MTYDVLTVFSTPFCGDCVLVKHWLDAKSVAYRDVDIGSDAEGREFVRRVAGGYLSVPTLVFPDGRVLVEPALGELQRALAK